MALLATTTLWAYDIEVDGIYYNFLQDNEVEVTNKSSYDVVYSGEIVIPPTITYDGKNYNVTRIGERAFRTSIKNSSLTSVTIPEGVVSIGNYAFQYCTALTSITIPNSITKIGTSAFESTPWYANLPDGILYIGKILYSYKGEMPANTSIVVKDGIEIINASAFAGCSNLIAITLPNSINSIEPKTFYNCDGLQNVVFGNSIDSIGEEAFYSCSSLSTITIPNSVTSIGNTAFYYCSSLDEIKIPKTVINIGTDAFIYCSPTSIVVEDGNPNYDSRNNCNALIETATNTLLVGCHNTVIPNTVTGITAAAFAGLDNLTAIAIPSGITKIGRCAFANCINLTSIVVDDDNQVYDSRNNCNAIIETATNTLIECSNNTIIPNTITSIGECAFVGRRKLTSVSIPNGVVSIGASAFQYCNALTSVSIPSSVQDIGNSAFLMCTALTLVTCEATTPPLLEWGAFNYIPFAEATLYVPAESIELYKAAEQWKDFGTILPLEQAPSNVEYVISFDSTNDSSIKTLCNGQLLILRDGKTYNAMGQEL